MGGYPVTNAEIRLMKRHSNMEAFIKDYEKQENFPPRKYGGLMSMWKNRDKHFARLEKEEGATNLITLVPAGQTMLPRQEPRYDLGATVQVHGNQYLKFAVTNCDSPDSACVLLRRQMRTTCEGNALERCEDFIKANFSE